MPIATFPAAEAASKTRKVETLLTGTSWVVPAGCLYVNAKLFGGGGGAGGPNASLLSGPGLGGAVVETNVATTPGASITYAIGAGGAAGAANTNGSQGGSTTFTGATTAVGGLGGVGGAGTGNVGTAGDNAGNGASATGANAGGAPVGGAGKIELEYWV